MMLCPKCTKGIMRVVDSRTREQEVSRCRKCNTCGFRMFTKEVELNKHYNIQIKNKTNCKKELIANVL